MHNRLDLKLLRRFRKVVYELTYNKRIRKWKLFVDTLEEMGHTIELIPKKLWNRVEINICERTVHRLRLTDLEINPTSLEADVSCHRAIRAVIEALKRINNAYIKEDVVYERL